MESQADFPEPVREWLRVAAEAGASDLHLVSGHSPVLRVHGRLEPMACDPLTAATIEELLTGCCSRPMLQKFRETKNADFSLTLDIGPFHRRFRANYFFNGGDMGACFRVIPASIPSFEWANFPHDVAAKLAHFRNGLVLMSGVAGSGKTTTLAMLIHLLNAEGGYRIITVEEPVEYVFPQQPGSVVTQREVGKDVDSFADGLKYGLRQDPDVMLVGEIRDRETAQMALSAAETGHLVFSTLHTRDAKGAVSRFADLFPQAVQGDVRSQLAMSLRAVVSQHLLPSVETGEKRELALEIMYNSSPISSAIRTGKLESIDNCILTGRSHGMITLNESVKRLWQANRISRETASRFVNDPMVLQ